MPLDVPTEIWLRVASFIPDCHLHNLALVSHLFYWVCTDRTYRHFVLDDDRPTRLGTKLKRLQNDTSVRQLVQSVSLHPRAVRSACLRAARNLKKTSGSASPRSSTSSFRDDSAARNMSEDLDLADSLVETLGSLPNVRELGVEWERPCAAEVPFCFALLKDSMRCLGPRLTTLSLATGLDVMASWVGHLHDLSCVQILRLDLGPNVVDAALVDDAVRQQEALAKFLNSTTSTLQSLSITCREHYRLCALFNSLQHLHNLSRLQLQLPFDQYHLDDTSGMNRFLRAHANIEYLSFTPIYCCSQSPTLWKSVQTTTWQDEGAWLSSVFDNVKFTNLQTLELGLSSAATSRVPRILPATSHIGTVVSGLGCLKIAGVTKSVGELELLLRSFTSPNGSPPPKFVNLEVHVLSCGVV